MPERNGILYRCVTRLTRIRKQRFMLFLCVFAGIGFAVWKVSLNGTKHNEDGYKKFKRKSINKFAIADTLQHKQTNDQQNSQQYEQGNNQQSIQLQQLQQVNDDENKRKFEKKTVYQFLRAGSVKDTEDNLSDEQQYQQLQQQVQDRYQQLRLQRQQHQLQQQEDQNQQQLYQEQHMQQQQKEQQFIYEQKQSNFQPQQINNEQNIHPQQQDILQTQEKNEQNTPQPPQINSGQNIPQLHQIDNDKNIQQPQQANVQQNFPQPPQININPHISQSKLAFIQQIIQQHEQSNPQPQQINNEINNGPQQANIQQNIPQLQQANIQQNIPQPQQANIQENILQPEHINNEQNIPQPQQANIQQNIPQLQQANIQQNIPQPQQANIQQNIPQPEHINNEQNIPQPQQANIQQNIPQLQQANIQQNIPQPQQANIQQNIPQPQQANIQQNIPQPQQANIQQNIPQPQQANIQQNIPQPEHINNEQNIPQPQQANIQQNIPQPQQANIQQNIPQHQQVNNIQNIPQPEHINNEQNIPQPQQAMMQQNIQQSQQMNPEQNIQQPRQVNNEENIPQPQQANALQPQQAVYEKYTSQPQQHQQTGNQPAKQQLIQAPVQNKFKQIQLFWPPPELKPAPFREKLPVVISWNILMGVGDYELVCKTRRCLLAHDHEERHKHQVVGILFYGTSFAGDGLPLPREPGHIWSVLHEESPKNNDWLFNAKGAMELFNLTATFKRESHYPLTTMWLKGEDELLSTEYVVPLEKKNSLRREGLAPVVFVHSDCNTPSDRSHYMQLLQKHLQIDSYGKCEHNKDFPKANMTFEINMEPMTDPEFFKVVAQYKFAFAFENTVCDDYTTEKFWRPLTLGVVPIVHGSPRIKDFAPTDHSIIDIRDFRSVQEVAEHITYLDAHDEEYRKYIDFKQTGITNPFLKNTLKNRDWGPGTFNGAELTGFQCHLCEKVHELQDILVSGQPAPHWQGSHVHYDCPRPKTFDEEGHYVNDNAFWGAHHTFGHYYLKSLQHHIDTIKDATFLEIQKYAKELEEYDRQRGIVPDV